MNHWLIASFLLIGAPAMAQTAKLDSKQPIEIAADNLEVLQGESKAIFSGNVIAKQGAITMRAAQMTVYYESANNAQPPAAAPAAGKGIKRIESRGNVVFVTPEESAQGDTAIYNVKTDTIDLVGNVVLTREQNILKGATLNYNLGTGRSLLNGGAAGKTTSGRVRGLFVPGKDA